MCTQGTLLSILICGFCATGTASAIAAADPVTLSAASFGHSRASRNPGRPGEAMAGLPGVCANSATARRDSRIYLNTIKPGLGENLPSEELKMPRLFDLARVPLDRTILHPFSPKIKSPAPENNGVPQTADPSVSGLC